MHDSAYEHPELAGSLLPDCSSREMKERTQKMDSKLALSYGAKDVEVPMPPLALAPEQENIRFFYLVALHGFSFIMKI